MKKIALTLGFAAATIATSLAFAGPGGGPGYGPGCADGTAATCQGGKGPGMGMYGGQGRGQGAGLEPDDPGRARRAPCADEEPDEPRRSATSTWPRTTTAMAERAKEKGVTLPEPRGNACERMQARGRFG